MTTNVIKPARSRKREVSIPSELELIKRSEVSEVASTRKSRKRAEISEPEHFLPDWVEESREFNIGELSFRGTRSETSKIQQVSRATGIAPTHLEELISFSKDNDVISMWRPVNPEATGKIEKDYLGKSMLVKAKSSNYKIIAGEVPCNASLSKIFDSQREKIPEFQKKTDEILQKTEGYLSEVKKAEEAGNNELLRQLIKGGKK